MPKRNNKTASLAPPLPNPGAQIRTARRAADLTQTELGERLGITKQAVADLEGWKEGRRRTLAWFLDDRRTEVWIGLGLGLELYAAAQREGLAKCSECGRPF